MINLDISYESLHSPTHRIICPLRNDARKIWRASMETRFEKAARDTKNSEIIFDISKGSDVDVSRLPLHHNLELTELNPRSFQDEKYFQIKDERFATSRNRKNGNS